MSTQAIQEFIGRSMVAAGALAALGAALDAKASGTPLDPVLDKRIQELLEAVGAGEILQEVGPQEAGTMRAIIRAMARGLNVTKLEPVVRHLRIALAHIVLMFDSPN